MDDETRARIEEEERYRQEVRQRLDQEGASAPTPATEVIAEAIVSVATNPRARQAAKTIAGVAIAWWIAWIVVVMIGVAIAASKMSDATSPTSPAVNGAMHTVTCPNGSSVDVEVPAGVDPAAFLASPTWCPAGTSVPTG